MSHVYLGVHRPPIAAAPSDLTTVVSPRQLSAEEIAGLIYTSNQIPLQQVRHHTLEYPQMPVDPVTALEHVQSRYSRCGRCHLSETRTFVVMHRGDPYSPVCLMGEGPGKDEDARGFPFVGPSGRLQDGICAESTIEPGSVSWINLVGCRPCASRFDKKDRPPSLVEKIACSERTMMLLRALRPRVVVCLGKQPATAFLGDDVPPPNTWHTLTDPAEPRDWVVVGYARHPANLLRVIPSPNSYKEYAASKLFWGGLARWMPELEKVSQWRFGLRYLNGFPPLVGSGAVVK